jgi:hypothetical protein
MKKVRKIFSSKLGAIVGAVALAARCLSPSAFGTGFVYQFDNAFSGGAPVGPAPWIDATFRDTANGVLLTVDNGGLVGGEFLGSLYLNINPADTAKIPNLTFTFESGSSGVAAPTIQTGEDGFQADGDGKYDILFNFDTSNAGRFGAGDTITYLISGIPGLTSADFEYLSTHSGGHGPFDAAGHVQGIGPSASDSGWVEPSMGPLPVATPEPATTVMLLFAGGIFGAKRLLRRK